MPLYSNAEKVIRENLESTRRGSKVHAPTIGCLSDAQLEALNRDRVRVKLLPVSGLIFFRGRHIYDSRIARDGYSIVDVVEQIRAAFCDASIVRFTPKMSVLQSTSLRDDGYGNRVRDEIALECTSRHPKSELFSVIPKGDKIKPADAEKTKAASRRLL